MVKCNRAGEYDCCASCEHSKPHEREEHGKTYCTSWMTCCTDGVTLIKVRCINENR